MTDAELKARAERCAENDFRWVQNLSEPWRFSMELSQAYLALLARGEVVKACPRCSAHEPEWLPEAGCWLCGHCMVHLDVVDHWQRILQPAKD